MANTAWEITIPIHICMYSMYVHISGMDMTSFTCTLVAPASPGPIHVIRN